MRGSGTVAIIPHCVADSAGIHLNQRCVRQTNNIQSAMAGAGKRSTGFADHSVGSNKKRKMTKSRQSSLSAKSSGNLKANPFEKVVKKPKASVLGTKVKGADADVSKSRSLAVKKRRDVLLKEWKKTSAATEGVFVDKRFGVGDSDLTDVDRAALRFQRERQIQIGSKRKKGDRFNLEDQLSQFRWSVRFRLPIKVL